MQRAPIFTQHRSMKLIIALSHEKLKRLCVYFLGNYGWRIKLFVLFLAGNSSASIWRRIKSTASQRRWGQSLMERERLQQRPLKDVILRARRKVAIQPAFIDESQVHRGEHRFQELIGCLCISQASCAGVKVGDIDAFNPKRLCIFLICFKW